MKKIRSFLWVLGLLLLAQNLLQAEPTKSKKFVFQVPAQKMLEVELNIQYSSNFRIRPNKESRQVVVEMDYDPEYLTADADYDPDMNHLTVELTGEHWKDNLDDTKRGDCTVYLPSGVPIDLESDSRVGEINFDLGGLSLKYIHLEVFAGAVQIRFRKPNPIILEDFDISGKIGELDLQEFGNARFRTGVIETGIGELDLDLGGAEVDFPQDLDINMKIGDTNVLIPENRPVKLRVSKFLFLTQVDLPSGFEKRGSHYFYNVGKNTKNLLYLKISPGLGMLSVDFE